MDNGVCSTCSSAVVRSSVMCNANFLDTKADAADSCEAPCGAVYNGVCSTCSSTAVCSSMACNANFFDTKGDASDGCEAPCGAVDDVGGSFLQTTAGATMSKLSVTVERSDV